MERASIDELFIDVTAFCYSANVHKNESESKDDDNDNSKEELQSVETHFRLQCQEEAVQSLRDTVICHESLVGSTEKEDEIGRALRLGCHVSANVRRVVFQKLGFTLSAGISTSKLVAKLGATYGKPNGQVRRQLCFTVLCNSICIDHDTFSSGRNISRCYSEGHG